MGATELQSPDLLSKKIRTLAIDINDRSTALMVMETFGAVRVATDYYETVSVINTSDKDLTVKKDELRALLNRAPKDIHGISVVLSDQLGFTSVQRVPIGTEDQMRNAVREALHRPGKLDLSKYRWSITPLTEGAVQTHGMTEAVTSTMCVMVSGIRKEVSDAICEAIRSEGYQIENLLMAGSCLVKSFHYFAGPLMDGAIVGLLHQSAAKCELFILRDGALAMYRDFPVHGRVNSRTNSWLEDVKVYIKQVESKLKTPLKCIFVTSERADAELIVQQLKTCGHYARTWNAAKKLPLQADNFPEKSLVLRPEFNVLVGAALTAADSAVNARVGADEDIAVAQRRFARKMIPPLTVAVCVLIVIVVALSVNNSRLIERQTLLEKQTKAQRDKGAADRVHLEQVIESIDELERFTEGRTLWSGIVSGLRHVDIAGIDLLQVRASENISFGESIRSADGAVTSIRRRNSGQFILEAKNTRGLDSLEEFLNSIQGNPLVSPLLHKRKPSRLLNNLQASDSPTVSIFTVEYSLNEKTF